ncbi:MAG TPA: argininosuccinate lyase, partial [Methylovirgula sp.]
MSNKMWGGRFADSPDAIMEEINASIDFDQKLAAQDIAGSLAHVAMLGETGILSKADAAAIAEALGRIRGEIENGQFAYS